MIETIFMIFIKILAGMIIVVLMLALLIMAIDIIKSFRKHGYWVEEEYSKEDDWGVNNYHYYICSECYEKISSQNFSKSWAYCPCCGAYMRE